MTKSLQSWAHASDHMARRGPRPRHLRLVGATPQPRPAIRRLLVRISSAAQNASHGRGVAFRLSDSDLAQLIAFAQRLEWGA